MTTQRKEDVQSFRLPDWSVRQACGCQKARGAARWRHENGRPPDKIARLAGSPLAPGSCLPPRTRRRLQSVVVTNLSGEEVDAVDTGRNELHALIVRDPNEMDVVRLGFPNALGDSPRPGIDDGFLALGHRARTALDLFNPLRLSGSCAHQLTSRRNILMHWKTRINLAWRVLEPAKGSPLRTAPRERELRSVPGCARVQVHLRPPVSASAPPGR